MSIAPCVIIGDSLGVGISHAMPQCVAQAKGGISAADWDIVYHPIVGRLTIISLGSNPGPHNEKSLEHIRSEIYGRAVWVLPASRDRELVAAIARKYGDLVVDSRDGGATALHIHPSSNGYREIAGEIASKIEGATK